VSHADDVAVTKRVIAAQDEPVVLVGHSYGGSVITEAGNDPNVAALVYVAAFAPDAGESVETLIADPPPDAPVPPILPPQDGFLFLDRDKFHDSFAPDVSTGEAAFMADSQVPWGLEALSGTISEPAWRSRPSWYLIATEDRMIPPPAQQQMSAGGFDRHGDRGQPCDLRVAARRRGWTHREGRRGSERGRALMLATYSCGQ
jgi:pimeloyl-ACP methyl ester carboxylesterase